MPKVTLEYKKRMKQSIIDAAISNFTKYGFTKTGMDDIAVSAKVSSGTLYLYFPSKEDLFYSVCQYFEEIISNKEITIFDNKRTLRADLGRFYDQDVQTLKDIERIWVDALNESKQNPKLRKILRDEWYDHENSVLEILRKTKKSGIFLQNCSNLRSLAISIVALFDGLAVGRMIGTEYEVSKKAFVDSVEALMQN